MEKRTFFEFFLALLIIALASIIIYMACHKEDRIEYVPVEIHDTIKIDSTRIVEHTKIVEVKTFDTICQYIDTLWHDTIEIPVEIPIEKKEYKDTLVTDTSKVLIDIKYSGFKATLDEIDIKYQYNRNMPVERKSDFWTNRFILSAGVMAGYSPIYRNVDIVIGVSAGIRIL